MSLVIFIGANNLANHWLCLMFLITLLWKLNRKVMPLMHVFKILVKNLVIERLFFKVHFVSFWNISFIFHSISSYIRFSEYPENVVSGYRISRISKLQNPCISTHSGPPSVDTNNALSAPTFKDTLRSLNSVDKKS